MKLWKRRVILFLSIILFLVLSPTIILYSSGYRLDFDNFTIKKVGMIIIESKPKDVDVIVNNRLSAKKTPYKMSNLTPKNYSIKLEKGGYHAWGKNLPVESQSVTWISNVLLFLSEPIKDIYSHEDNIIESQISPDQKYYAYIIVNEDNNYILRLLDLKTRENINIFLLDYFINNNLVDFIPESISNILWSHDSKNIIITLSGQNNRKYMIVDINNINKSYLLEKDNLSKITWDNNDSKFIYYLKNNNLEKLNITNQTINNIIAQNVDQYDLVANSILYTKTIKNKNEIISSIYKINKNSSEEIEDKLKNIGIINEEIDKIKAQKEDSYLLLTNTHNLYLSLNENILKIGSDIIGFKWSSNKHFLFYNDTNIWHYKIEGDKNTYHPQYLLNEPVLALESLNKIDLVDWHPDNEHILYSSEGSINILELDRRDVINNYQILNNIINISDNNVAFNDEGDKLFHMELIDNKHCLVEATLYHK